MQDKSYTQENKFLHVPLDWNLSFEYDERPNESQRNELDLLINDDRYFPEDVLNGGGVERIYHTPDNKISFENIVKHCRDNFLIYCEISFYDDWSTNQANGRKPEIIKYESKIKSYDDIIVFCKILNSKLNFENLIIIPNIYKNLNSHPNPNKNNLLFQFQISLTNQNITNQFVLQYEEQIDEKDVKNFLIDKIKKNSKL